MFVDGFSLPEANLLIQNVIAKNAAIGRPAVKITSQFSPDNVHQEIKRLQKELLGREILIGKEALAFPTPGLPPKIRVHWGVVKKVDLIDLNLGFKGDPYLALVIVLGRDELDQATHIVLNANKSYNIVAFKQDSAIR